MSELREDALRAAVGGTLEVLESTPLGGGACQDNVKVRWRRDGAEETWVVRGDAETSLPGSLGRRTEYEVIEAARAGGVRTPEARWRAQGLLREGAWAYVLEWCPGEALGPKLVRAPEDQRRVWVREAAEQLAALHRITPEDAPTLLTEDARALGLAGVAAQLDGLSRPQPALEVALAWLREHLPETSTRRLIHGDFRVGNLQVTEAGVAGVFDWEFAHWGDPAEDLAWFCLRDWRFGQIARGAGGLGPRADFYAAYEAAGGTVDRATVRAYEVLGNLRWAAGCRWQGERYRQGRRDLELLAAEARAQEMEYEALRLIEEGV